MCVWVLRPLPHLCWTAFMLHLLSPQVVLPKFRSYSRPILLLL
uniref:Uncharacterized protein n=1 Tax=Arundo donax TaxID=35708 RepID=A0A0A9HRL1_ARUDO